nr:minor coat protein duplication [Crinivirus sp.]
MSLNSQDLQIEEWSEIEDNEEENQTVKDVKSNTFIQYFEISYKDFDNIEFDFKNFSKFSSLKAIFSIRFIIPNGVIVYSFNTAEIKGHSIQQHGGSLITYGYWIVDPPRKINADVSCPFKIFKTEADVMISLFGWRCYGIKGSFSPSKIQICISLPVNDYKLSKDKKYLSNYLIFEEFINNLKVNNNIYTIKSFFLLYSDRVRNYTHPLTLVKSLKLSEIKDSSDLKILEMNDQITKPISNVAVEKPANTVEVKPMEKPIDNLVVQEIGPSKNFVTTNSSRISLDADSKIFEFAVSYYKAKGISAEDSKLLIYQMGVSFCTSKNAISDNNHYLIWKDNNGKAKRFYKSAHSRMLNSLIELPCNIERLLLRNRSDEILDLLRKKALEWPLNHAIRRGIKPEFAYLACDFFDLKKAVLSEQEMLALNSTQFYVQMRHKHKRVIVNVNQLL